MNLNIKKAKIEDTHLIESLIAKTIDISFRGYYSEEARTFLKKRVHSIKQIKSSFNFGDVYLFEDSNGNVIGTGSILTSKITRVYLHPQYQHKGYGKFIMQYLEEKAREKGIKEIILDALLASISFYVSIGYEVLDDTTYSIPNNEKIYMFKMEKKL